MRGTEVVLRVVGGVMELGSIALLLWGFGCEAAVLLGLEVVFGGVLLRCPLFPCGFWLWCGGLLVLVGLFGWCVCYFVWKKKRSLFCNPEARGREGGIPRWADGWRGWAG